MTRSILFVFASLFLSGCFPEQRENTKNPEQPDPSITVETAAIRYKTQEPVLVGKPKKPYSAVVRLSASLGNTESRGTGFFIKYKGKEFLVTAKHTVIHANTLSASYGNHSVSFKVISHAFGEQDIAVFLVERENGGKSLELESKNSVQSVPKNDLISGVPESWKPIECSVFGYPSGQGFIESLGKITHRIDLSGSRYLVSTLESRRGLSGSPWISHSSGKVLAVHAAALGSGENRRPGGISVEEIYPLLDSLLEEKD